MIDDILKRLGMGRSESVDNSKRADLENEYAKTRYTEYLEARKNSLKESLEISDRFDKSILALSGGSLGLSFTFLEKFAPHPIYSTLPILLVAWLLLLLSILSGVKALLSVQGAIQNDLKELEKDYHDFVAAFEAGELPGPPPINENTSRESTRDISQNNRFSMVALGLGLMWLCVFSIVNLYTTSLAPREQVLELRVQLPESMPASPMAGSNALGGSSLQPSNPGVASSSKDQYGKANK